MIQRKISNIFFECIKTGKKSFNILSKFRNNIKYKLGEGCKHCDFISARIFPHMKTNREWDTLFELPEIDVEWLAYGLRTIGKSGFDFDCAVDALASMPRDTEGLRDYEYRDTAQQNIYRDYKFKQKNIST